MILLRMKTLNHRLKKHDIGLIDSQSGKVLKTQKAVDVSDELTLDADSEPLWLYYTTTAERGEIVQLRQGCAAVHYFTEWMHREKDEDSALSHWAAWTNSSKERLIELCLKYSPTHAKKENVRPLAPADNKTPTKQENV